jgi:predicted AlkP superfamily phosphohydrolase/phosphomutase
MVMNSEMFGHIYLNVKGRNPHGCIKPGSEYNNIIKELRSRFSQLTNPVTHEHIFEQVVTSSELFNSHISDVEKLGDIILIPKKGYGLNRKIFSKGKNIELMAEQSLLGCHCHEGMYIIHGPHIKHSENKMVHIVNFAPTIYSIIEAKMPDYLDGKPLKQIFSKDFKIQYQPPKKSDIPKSQKNHSLSEQEQNLIRQRLSELGYMD